MALNEAVPVIPHGIYIFYTENPGGAFSVLPHATWLFIAVAIIVVAAGVFAHVRFRPGIFSTLALGLVMGGALGNMFDRAVSGVVTDYVYLRFINFPVFNLADACIDVGIAIWLIRSFRMNQSHPEDQREEG